MAFKPEDHLMKLKGSDYLPAVWRVVWFRDEHPDGQIETEVVFWDHDKQEIMVRATVLAPKTGARASAHCVCSLAEFKNGYCEKAETQAVGRALALLGYGTALAGQDLDEGERPADAPTTVAKNGSGGAQAKVAAEPQSRAPQSRTVVEPVGAAPSAAAGTKTGAADWTQKQLGARVRELAGVTLPKLANWQDLARTYGLPVPAQPGDMTQDWLLGLYQTMQTRVLEERIRQVPTEGEVRAVMMDAIGLRDRREISMEQYGALDEQADARYGELAGPSPEEHDLDHEGVALAGDTEERAKELGRRISAARSEEEITAVLRASQQAKDQGQITQDHRVGLLRMADTRRAALSGPLTANAV